MIRSGAAADDTCKPPCLQGEVKPKCLVKRGHERRGHHPNLFPDSADVDRPDLLSLGFGVNSETGRRGRQGAPETDTRGRPSIYRYNGDYTAPKS